MGYRIKKMALREKKQEKETAKFAAYLLLRFPSMPEAEAKICASFAIDICGGLAGRANTYYDRLLVAAIAYARLRLYRY